MNAIRTTADSATSPQSAYVHVPFCRHKCGYCNFTVVAGRDNLMDEYLAAVERELTELRYPRPVDTLFLGGGTPTQLPSSKLQALLDVVLRWFPLLDEAEFSVEANPEDLTIEVVDVLASYGVNRVSLGVQSFHRPKLRLLERVHDAEDVRRCLQHLRPKITSLSVDLIFGTPRETLDVWRADLAAALNLLPDHISTYGLTFEKGTSFYSRKLKSELSQLSEESEREMYEFAIDTLVTHDYQHYEVSNFAKPGHACRHNENYWLGGEYYGVGPGAASYVAGVRRNNHRSTTTYLNRMLQGHSAVVASEPLDAEDKARERLVFGLRRIDGIDTERFENETGRSLESLMGDNLHWLCAEGLLVRTDTHLRLTRKGLLVSDSIWPYLL